MKLVGKKYVRLTDSLQLTVSKFENEGKDVYRPELKDNDGDIHLGLVLTENEDSILNAQKVPEYKEEVIQKDYELLKQIIKNKTVESLYNFLPEKEIGNYGML